MRVEFKMVKALRIDNGWTQQQLADVTNLNIRTIQRIENQGIASIESVNSLCAVFKVDRSLILTPEETLSMRKTKELISIRKKASYLITFLSGAFIGGFLVFVFSWIGKALEI